MRYSIKVEADKREPMQEVVEPNGVAIYQSRCPCTATGRLLIIGQPCRPLYLCCVYIRNTACVFVVCGFHRPMTYRV
jgi:hypothetical protein